jgi:hypothetical protein
VGERKLTGKSWRRCHREFASRIIPGLRRVGENEFLSGLIPAQRNRAPSCQIVAAAFWPVYAPFDLEELTVGEAFWPRAFLPWVVFGTRLAFRVIPSKP